MKVLRTLRWAVDGAQHGWCASMHTELKSIEPIFICAEYISFVLLFSHLKWSLISGNWFFIEKSDPVRTTLFYLCVYSFIYLHSCSTPSSFFSSSTTRHWSPSGRSSRPLPDQRWRPAASPHPKCCCCPLSPSLCPSDLRLRVPCTHTGKAKQERNKEKQMVWPRFIYSSHGWKCNDSENQFYFLSSQNLSQIKETNQTSCNFMYMMVICVEFSAELDGEE